MYTRDSFQPLDARLERRGFHSAGTEGGKPSAVEGDSPTYGPVDGPLAPEPRPGGVEGDSDSVMRPQGTEPRKLDGAEASKRIEDDAARHRRQSD